MHVYKFGVAVIEDANQTLLIDVTLQTLKYEQYLVKLQVIEEPALVILIHLSLEKEVNFVDGGSVEHF